MKVIHFNTGRHYAETGQPITAALDAPTEQLDATRLETPVRVRFYDHARMIAGEYQTTCPAAFSQKSVLRRYDANSYDMSVDALDLSKIAHPDLTNEYAFELQLFSIVRIKATSEQEARDTIRNHLDAADAHFGTLPDGTRLDAEASVEGTPELIEINGEIVL